MIKYPVSQPRIGALEKKLVNEVLDSTFVSMGPMVAQFERELADYLNVRHVVCTTSGTTALHLAFAALGIQPGDEVIVPDLTYAATVSAIKYTGATPVFVDIDLETYCLNTRLTADAITPRTRAIVPVHLYGNSVNMGEVHGLAQENGLLVIEDACEGFSGRWYGWPLGTIGDAGCFSFFSNKLIATGEGGAVVTNDDGVARRLRHLRAMCQTSERYVHDGVGFNYRMTDLQAALGVAQLQQVDDMIEKRFTVIDRYRRHLCYHGLRMPSRPVAPWLFTFELPEGVNRYLFMQRIADFGIDSRPTFAPMHQQFGCGGEGLFPVAEWIGRQGLSLPTYADLPLEVVDEICEVVCSLLNL